MTANAYSATPAWEATARYTAASAIDVLVSNSSDEFTALWSTTTSDTAPVITPEQANALLPGHSIALQLLSGERLWLASRSGLVSVNVEV
jgi:hypothetical protein